MSRHYRPSRCLRERSRLWLRGSCAGTRGRWEWRWTAPGSSRGSASLCVTRRGRRTPAEGLGTMDRGRGGRTARSLRNVWWRRACTAPASRKRGANGSGLIRSDCVEEPWTRAGEGAGRAVRMVRAELGEAELHLGLRNGSRANSGKKYGTNSLQRGRKTRGGFTQGWQRGSGSP